MSTVIHFIGLDVHKDSVLAHMGGKGRNVSAVPALDVVGDELRGLGPVGMRVDDGADAGDE